MVVPKRMQRELQAMDTIPAITKTGFIYLAAPYTMNNTAPPAMRQWRYEAVTKVASGLMQAGITVYSPVSHGYAMSHVGKVGVQTTEWWLNHCIGMLSRASGLFVLRLPEWNKSLGVQTEIQFAEANNIPIIYIDCDEDPFNTEKLK